MTSIIAGLILMATIMVFSIGSVCADEGDTKKAAFKQTLQELMPLTPEQIEVLMRLQEERQEAVVGRPAITHNRSVTLTIQPGMNPEDIITLPGYATMIAFYDQTGAVWPVKTATTGNPKAFVIADPQDKENPTNIITTSCVKESGHSNLTVELQDLDIPLMFPIKIAVARKKVPPRIDGILTVRINRFGPRAKPPVVEPRPADPVSDNMISYLDGVAPKEAELVQIEPPNTEITVWKQGGLTILRTKNPILWPAWTSAIRGPGQTRVYELPDVSTILVSSDGQIKKYTITGKAKQ
jgi:hypothetical protein